ncbi:MAG: IS1595 family transposase [Rhodomicrobium sp.]
MARQKQPKQIIQMTVAQFEAMFPDEEACCAYLAGKRWPEGVHCPRCGATDPHKLDNKPWHWQCYQCATQSSYRFSHLTGTIFENTNKPLRDWFRVIHYMLTSKKGVSARQMHRVMGFGSYKTAWYMMHRVRAALANEEFEKLAGIVEVDETFVGGLAKNRHIDKRGKGGGTGGAGKTPIAGAVSRKGNVVARVIENVRGSTLAAFVDEAVSTKVSLLCTDQFTGYRGIGKKFPHAVINHAAGQYVIGAVHTQTIEGFWSIFKRGVVGSFHKISKKYMPLYVAEFQFRYNNRMNQDIFGAAIEEC